MISVLLLVLASSPKPVVPAEEAKVVDAAALAAVTAVCVSVSTTVEGDVQPESPDAELRTILEMALEERGVALLYGCEPKVGTPAPRFTVFLALRAVGEEELAFSIRATLVQPRGKGTSSSDAIAWQWQSREWLTHKDQHRHSVQPRVRRAAIALARDLRAASP